MNRNPYRDVDALQTDVNDDAALLDTPPFKAARLDLAVVCIAGADAIEFVHGQFSGDCRALSAGDTLLTAWCSPKGRVLFMPRLLRARDDTLYALLPNAQAQAFVKRLRMFVLRAKVTVDDCTSSHGVLAIDGLAAPPNIEWDELIGARDGTRRWLLGPRAAVADRWDALVMPALSANGMRLATVRRGEPSLDAALTDQFLPQELNLDWLAGVSFNKGCYPGQEIVARVKFRGTVKRRVQRLGLAGVAAIVPGSRLLGTDGASRGTVLTSAHAAAGQTELLAVVDLDAGQLTFEGGTTPLTPLSLPYTMDSA